MDKRGNNMEKELYNNIVKYLKEYKNNERSDKVLDLFKSEEILTDIEYVDMRDLLISYQKYTLNQTENYLDLDNFSCLCDYLEDCISDCEYTLKEVLEQFNNIDIDEVKTNPYICLYYDGEENLHTLNLQTEFSEVFDYKPYFEKLIEIVDLKGVENFKSFWDMINKVEFDEDIEFY